VTSRRNPKVLQQRVTRAKTKNAKAIAYFQLAVFHDNNSREAKAIPSYLAAIRLGLPPRTRAKALAWLASSLYKTDSPAAALRYVRQSLRSATGSDLVTFAKGLERRILRKLSRS
jgi:hypothetical protein